MKVLVAGKAVGKEGKVVRLLIGGQLKAAAERDAFIVCKEQLSVLHREGGLGALRSLLLQTVNWQAASKFIWQGAATVALTTNVHLTCRKKAEKGNECSIHLTWAQESCSIRSIAKSCSACLLPQAMRKSFYFRAGTSRVEAL
jgi:hypothetical protein